MHETTPGTLPAAIHAAERRRGALALELLLIGAFTLFLELLLIRWLATEIRVFAYFKNLTLIACFFGIGWGCLRTRPQRAELEQGLGALLALVALVVLPDRLGAPLFDTLNRFLAELSDMPLWTWGSRTTTLIGQLGAVGLLLAVFLLLAFAFAPFGRRLSEAMTASPSKYLAYGANLLGSFLGVAAFELVSSLSLPPPAWFLIAFAIALPLGHTRRERVVVAVGAAATMLLFLAQKPPAGETVWSPYQKVTISPIRLDRAGGKPVEVGFSLLVNQAFHQKAVNLDPRFLRAHPDLFPEAPYAEWTGYNLVYRLVGAPPDVLVVGAGTGNDVAAALRNGAGHVDAVEIDPKILQIGRRLHPERPYDDPRVTVVVDDARSFLKRTTRKYDLIVFGALDSHTVNSAMSNLRIDNYVYTVEAFREVKKRLKPGGVVWLLFAFERRATGDRLFAMLGEAFGHHPIAFFNQDVRALSPSGGGGTFVTDRDGAVEARINATPRFRDIVAQQRIMPQGNALLASDDWPYLYVRSRAIPHLYLVVMGVIVGVVVLLVRRHIGELRSLDWHFFLLGAAFLLLEVQSVSRMALLFGNTWEVSATVIGSILFMVLAANAVASRVPRGALPFVYIALAASIVGSYSLAMERVLALAPLPRLLVAGSVMALPVFFAGIVFSRTFAATERSGLALGSNLLGSIVGGACESASFVVGLNALGMLALLFYTGSFAVLVLSGRMRLSGAAARSQ